MSGQTRSRSTLVALLALGLPLRAQQPPALGDLSLEELGSVDITSVSKRAESLLQAPASVFVITREDIRRSGATSIAEALRLAPNLQVAQIASSQYAISARGFNTTSTNKLLVLIDGRSVYTTLVSGVFWDAQDTLLSDIDRIEVISGPGGTLWGSNAVNGVINVITRKSQDTQGTLLSARYGTEARGILSARNGGPFRDNVTYRVYAKYADRNDTVKPSGKEAQDSWRTQQAGFRFDWAKGRDSATLQGDAYKGFIDQAVQTDRIIEGSNVIGRWNRDWSPESGIQVQVYYDHTRRDYPGTFLESLNTVDLDVQHHFTPRADHAVVWGFGYRLIHDEVGGGGILTVLPTDKHLPLANLFGQDTLTLIPDALHLTLGTKLEYNTYTGWEVQPSGRLAWTPSPGQLLWTAVSRAVRTPSRIDHDFYYSTPPFLTFKGGPDFHSESVIAYEMGYRTRPTPRVTLSVSPFFNVYKDLRSVEQVATNTYVIRNGLEGHSWGAEAWADLLITEAWRLKPGYSFVRVSLTPRPGAGSLQGTSAEGNDPRHRFLLTSQWNVASGLEADFTVRYVSALPNPAVPAYWNGDLRLGWRPAQGVELSLVGQNVFNKQHPEFGAAASRNEIQRGGYLRVTWAF